MEQHTAATYRLELEVGPDQDPIAGQIRDGAGRERSFNGWIELSALLEDLRGRRQENGDREAER